jgi:hypothetical protein
VVNLEADTASAGETFPLAVTKNAGNAYLAGAVPVVNLTEKPNSLPLCEFGNWNYYASMGKHWATVGQTYVPTTYATQQFSYTSGQFSSIGVGVSGTGKKGSFSASGTYAWSNAVASTKRGTWPKYGARRSVFYRTEFHLGEYVCSTSGTFMQHANGYFGGAHIEKPPSVPHTPNKWCASYVGGYTYYSTNTAAVTWTKSLGIHAGLDFDASVQTGYDNSAQVIYHLNRERDICGSNGPPGGTPRKIVVR